MDKYISKVSEPFKRIFYRYINDLYTLNDAIMDMDLLDDGRTLFLELSGPKFHGRRGEKFKEPVKLYGSQDSGYAGYYHFPQYKHGNPQKMRKVMEIRRLGNFGDFLWVVREMVNDEYERHYKLKEGDVALDVGANIGIVAVKQGKEVGPTGRVIAIEPEENNLEYFKRNVEANELGNVTIVPKAVWSEKGMEKLYISEAPGWHSMDKRTTKIALYGTREFRLVETDTIDNIVRESKVDRVDFMKMDVEGVEIEALEGAKETLKYNDIKLAVETHHRNGESTHENVIPFLKGMGLKIVEFKPGIIGLVYAEK